MSVRWYGVTSSERPLRGSGPQGSTLGLLEYISQSNDNTEGIPSDMKYKWLDDLSTLEIVNLLTIGISSYNIRSHVPSDVPVHNGFEEAKNLITQRHIENIAEWTEKKANEIKLQKILCNGF